MPIATLPAITKAAWLAPIISAAFFAGVGDGVAEVGA